MKRSWTTLSQLTNGTYAEQDFERAAWRLVTEQVLYAADQRSRVAYHLVEEFLDDFATALAPLGIRLERKAEHRYIIALPRHAEGTPVRLDETLFLLILRQRYDEAINQGQLEEHGEAVVELPDLQEVWPVLTGRPMPDIGTLRTLAGTLRRWGCCRLVESDGDDLQPFHLMVRPAIVDIVGKQWLQRLDQHNLDDDDDSDGDADSDAAHEEDDDAAA